MDTKIRSLTHFGFAFFFLLAGVSCAPQPTPTPMVNQATATIEAATLTPASEIPTETALPATAIPSGGPVYTLATQLPDAPAQVHLYTQDIPAKLPSGERLTALLKRLQVTGTATTREGEGGEAMLNVSGGFPDMYLWSDDPLILVMANMSKLAPDSTPVKILPPEVRAQAAKEFLAARGMLDFPYIMEPPQLSRERDQTIHVVSLIDGIPVYDNDPLNGQLAVLFDSVGDISGVIWHPLKLTVGDAVKIMPAALAWDQLVAGDAPKQPGLGQCWEAMVFDPAESYGTAGIVTENENSACGNSVGQASSYAAATITDVKLVYFAQNLTRGMQVLSLPKDSPALVVFPMWQFSGTTSDKRELRVLWPAMTGK